jgi:Fe-S-cluster containining protein
MGPQNKKKPPKAFSKKNPCRGCEAECCRYFAVYISEPEDLAEFDAIKWYLHHKQVCVYIDREGDWYVHVEVPCKHIGSKGQCTTYESRPVVCRSYKTDSCEQADVDEGNVAEFYDVTELDEFFKLNYRVVGKDLERRHRRYRTAAE